MKYHFDKDIAIELGVNAAIMYSNIQYRRQINETKGQNIHDGTVWTFNSHEAFMEIFPFWSKSQIKRILTKLEDSGYIIKGSYNQNPYDRTTRYGKPIIVGDEIVPSTGHEKPGDEIVPCTGDEIVSSIYKQIINPDDKTSPDSTPENLGDRDKLEDYVNSKKKEGTLSIPKSSVDSNNKNKEAAAEIEKEPPVQIAAPVRTFITTQASKRYQVARAVQEKGLEEYLKVQQKAYDKIAKEYGNDKIDSLLVRVVQDSFRSKNAQSITGMKESKKGERKLEKILDSMGSKFTSKKTSKIW